jgi:surfactin synthase thioesterase subunit
MALRIRPASAPLYGPDTLPAAERASAWIVRSPHSRGGLRLYCFASAGGSASNYAPWSIGLQPEIEACAVQLPGRGARCFEAPCRDLDSIVSEISAAIEDDVDGPFAFYGHSLGGLVAFEVARCLQARGSSAPCVMFISGCDPPQVERKPSKLSGLDDDALIERLRTFNGTPAELLDDREFMSLILPAIRADFDLAGNYRYRAGDKLDTDLVVLTGQDDPHAPPDRAAGWALQTNGKLRIEQFQGDHFFHQAELPAVWRLVKQAFLRAVHAAQ